MISKTLFGKIRSNEVIKKCKTKLFAYNKEQIAFKGKVHLLSEYKGKYYLLDFKVVDIDSQALLGLNTCKELNLVKRIMVLNKEGQEASPNEVSQADKLIEEYDDLFNGLGNLSKHHIVVDKAVPPIVHPPRKVPFGLLSKLKDTLKRLESTSVIAQVNGPTDWVNSLVIAEKKNGSLRLCLDPRDLNMVIKREHYPVPTAQEITGNLSEAKYFSTLDAKDGFWQIELDEESTDLCCFNTPFGRFKFLRILFGIVSASKVFQKKVIEAFEGIEGVDDDVLVTGRTIEEHDHRLHQVLQRARERNIKFNKDKLKICIPEVEYIGDIISTYGLKPDNSKIKAVCELPTPSCGQDVMRLLGMVNYLSKYIPNMLSITDPLREFLKDNDSWYWEDQQKHAFETIKTVLTCNSVLKFYDSKKPVRISVDASCGGLGAVLMQDDHPIAYASRALTETQKRWVQIEKEMYPMVFGCEKFNQYIYGKHVDIETNHKPLEAIIKKPLSQVLVRIQRLLLRLQRYDITLTYKPGKVLYIADTLSRAYLTGRDPSDIELDNEIDCRVHCLVKRLPLAKSKFEDFKEASASDIELQQLKKVIISGWPDTKQEVLNEVKPYWNFRDEINKIEGILLKGEKIDKITVPTSLGRKMLVRIHEVHLGIQECM